MLVRFYLDILSILYLRSKINSTAKLNELEENTPPIEELNYCTENAYTPELFIQMEALLLNQLRWDVNPITAFHFLEFFLPYALNEEDKRYNQPILQIWLLRADVTKSASFFVDICRQGRFYLI